MSRKNIISVKPECLSKLDSALSFKILEGIFDIYKEGVKGVEVLDSIDFNEDPNEIADYSLLFDLEDILIEKDSNFTSFGQVDPSEIVRYANNAFTYWNEVCELLDIDSCSNTIMECAEMQTKLKFAVANATTFIYNVFGELIKYLSYLKSIQMPELSKQVTVQNPEYEHVELNLAPYAQEILRREGEPENPDTLLDFAGELLRTISNYPTQNTVILKYFSDYSDFYDLVERYDQVDIQPATGLVMPYDVKYILAAMVKDSAEGEQILDKLNDKIEGRLGSLSGIQPITIYEQDSLVWLSEYAKSSSDYEKLFINERYISSDLDRCYLAIARKDLSFVITGEGIYSGMDTTSLF